MAQENDNSLENEEEEEEDHKYSYVQDLWDAPDGARLYALGVASRTKDFCQFLNNRANLEDKYGKMIEKSGDMAANVLNSYSSSSAGTLVGALGALAGSIESLSKNHQVYSRGLLMEVTQTLTPMYKEYKRDVEQLTGDQIAVQNQAEALRIGLAKRRNDGAALYEYKKARKTQEKGLRQMLSGLHGMEIRRAERMKSSMNRVGLAGRVMLEKTEQDVLALKGVIEASMADANLLDLEREFALIVARVSSKNNLIQADSKEEVLERLRIELSRADAEKNPEIIEAASEVNENASKVCQVAQKQICALRDACEFRGKQLAKIAEDLDNDVDGEQAYDDTNTTTEEIALRAIYDSCRKESMMCLNQSKQYRIATAQLGIILDAYTEAKRHMMATSAQANKDLTSKLNAHKQATQAFERHMDTMNKSKALLDQAKEELSIEPPSTAEDTNVINKMFFRQSSSMSSGEKVRKLEAKYAKATAEYADARQTLNDCTNALESQRNACTMKIASVVSTFLSAHADMSSKVRTVIQQVVETLSETLPEHHASVGNMLNKIQAMEPLEDIKKFLKMENMLKQEYTFKSPPPPTRKMIIGTVTPSKILPIPTDEQVMPDPASNVEDDDEDDDFVRKFGLPTTETVVESYSCAFLPSKVPLHGRMFLTQRFLCFRTIVPMFGISKIVVALRQVRKVRKAAVAWGLMANSLVVVLEEVDDAPSHDLYFTSLFNRDDCYNQIIQLCTILRDLPPTPSSVENANDGTIQQQKWKEYDPRRVTPSSKSTTNETTTKSGGFLRLAASPSPEPQLSKYEKECSACGQSGRCPCWHVSSADYNTHQSEVITTHHLETDIDSCIEMMVMSNGETDSWFKLGARAGDYDYEATPWVSEPPFPEFALDENKAPRIDEPPPSVTYERVIRFKHPISGGYGKQIADTTQRQRVLYTKEKHATLYIDTSFTGFPFSDSFGTRSIWVFRAMHHIDGAPGNWTELQVSTTMIWLKSISVPFVKGKIERGSIEGLKVTVDQWVDLVLHSENKTIIAPSQEEIRENAVAEQILVQVQVVLGHIVDYARRNPQFVTIVSLQVYSIYLLHCLQ